VIIQLDNRIREAQAGNYASCDFFFKILFWGWELLLFLNPQSSLTIRKLVFYIWNGLVDGFFSFSNGVFERVFIYLLLLLFYCVVYLL
jgi:hypothetical protein